MPRKKNAVPAEVFVSHSAKNLAFVNRLVNELTGHGIKCFFSAKSIRGAQEWHDEIGAALERCDWFMVTLSPQSVESEWVKRELIAALQEKRYIGRIVPLLYRKCDEKKLSWALSGFQHINFRRNFNAGVEELLAIFGIAGRP